MIPEPLTSDKGTRETITQLHRWTDKLITFRTTRTVNYDFTPGQYARLGLPDDGGAMIWRAYSITSTPGEDTLEFYGIVVEGGVLRAASGGAGESGHIPISDDGPLCSCGNHGCLEAYIGERALVTRAREQGIISASAGIAALQAAAESGDERAARIYSEAGALLGRTLAGVVHTIDPAFVVILGEGTTAWRFWSFGFEPAFRSHLMRHRRSLPVEVETWQIGRASCRERVL